MRAVRGHSSPSVLPSPGTSRGPAAQRCDDSPGRRYPRRGCCFSARLHLRSCPGTLCSWRHACCAGAMQGSGGCPATHAHHRTVLTLATPSRADRAVALRARVACRSARCAADRVRLRGCVGLPCSPGVRWEAGSPVGPQRSGGPRAARLTPLDGAAPSNVRPAAHECPIATWQGATPHDQRRDIPGNTRDLARPDLAP